MITACTAFACVRSYWVVVWHCSAVTYHLDSVLALPADAAKPCSTPLQRFCPACLPPAREPLAADHLLMVHHFWLSCQSLACKFSTVKVLVEYHKAVMYAQGRTCNNHFIAKRFVMLAAGEEWTDVCYCKLYSKSKLICRER